MEYRITNNITPVLDKDGSVAPRYMCTGRRDSAPKVRARRASQIPQNPVNVAFYVLEGTATLVIEI
jgi:hypothetical protein